MTENVELKFPFGEEDGCDSAWPVEQEPTDLLALWPGDDASKEPPTQTEVLAALSTHLGDAFEALGDVDVPSPDVCWAVAGRIEGLPVPVMIWAQEAMPVAPGELNDPVAESCQWAIGFETMLDGEDPLSSYILLTKSIAGALPESPALLDINSTMILHRARLDELYGDAEGDGAQAIEPAADDLWMIHAVQAGENGSAKTDGGPVWLHTHGLWRCGLPELEMLEVPPRHAATAAQLLNDIASLMFEFPPSAPGEPYEIGDDLAIVFQPWQSVIESVDASTPGGMNDRQNAEPDNSHAGVRAVVCGVERRGAFRQVWAWPKEVIERLENDEATIYMTHRATVRQSRLARARWTQFATAFAAAHKGSLINRAEPLVAFLVKAGFAIGEPEEERREHLWFEVSGFKGNDAEGRLINQPVNCPSMNRGDQVCVSRSQISDWQVQTPMGSFGPQNVGMLWNALDVMRGEANNTGDATRARKPG